MIDTPDGKWYAMLFQEHGAVGRIPVLLPVHWENDFPDFGTEGRVPHTIANEDLKPGHIYQPLYTPEAFASPAEGTLSLARQWNHKPVAEGWSLNERPGQLRLRTQSVVPNLVKATNTLTQRTFGPMCEAEVLLDGTGLAEGDYAGLCLLQSHYACIALTVRDGKYYLMHLRQGAYPAGQSVQSISKDAAPGQEVACVAVDAALHRLKLVCDFQNNIDFATLWYHNGVVWEKLGEPLQMHYLPDHFIGARIGLFCFSTQQSGGVADFANFKFRIIT